MDRQTFRDALHKRLREKLLPTIERYLNQRFDAYRQQGRYLSALDRKYDSSNVIKDGLTGVLQNIRGTLDGNDQPKLADAYTEAVDAFVSEFPEELNWVQDEDRFVKQDEDSLLLTAGKAGKRLSRSVAKTWHRATRSIAGLFTSRSNGQWQLWQQKIAVRRFLKYHLLDMESLQQGMHAVERMQLQIITDIEELIVQRCRENSMPGLSDFAVSLEEELDAKQESLNHQLAAAVDELESKIVEQIDKLGTIEHRNAFYTEQRIKRKKEEFEQQLSNRQEQWRKVNMLLSDRARDVARFSNLQASVNSKAEEFRENLRVLFQTKIQEPLDRLDDLLKNSIERAGKGDATAEVTELKRELSEFVEKQLVNPLQPLHDKQVLNNKVEHFFEDILVTGSQAEQQALLLYDMELESNPPKLSQRQIEWRQVTIRVLREQFIGALAPREHGYQQFMAGLLEDILEIKNIIEVNLESALAARDEDVDQEVEHPAKIAREALERIATKVDELQDRTAKQWEIIDKSITDGEEAFRKMLLGLLHEGDIKQLQLLNAKYKVKETTKGWKTVVDSRWARLQDRLMLWSRFGWQKVRHFGSAVREFAGFKESRIEEVKRADIATYLSETDQKMKSLPYIYRRVFNFDALADERFYVSIPETTTTFKRSYQQWQSTFPANFAVIGEKGSGKSTLLNRVSETELDDEPVIEISLDQSIWSEEQLVEVLGPSLGITGATSVEEIVTAINQKSNRSVVILEGMQNSFIRNINGYSAIEKLCYLISETRKQLFWIVSCSRYAWRFLDKTVQVSEYFSHIATTDRLDADQIKSVIMNRHRSSGYSLQFEADPDTQKSRSYRKLKDQGEEVQEFLQESYFEELTELAEGNASVAMIFWIRSIRDFDDTYFYIQPLEITTVEMIEELSPQVLFTLAAFVLHDTLSDEDLSKIMGIPLEESRLLLNRLQSRGLLVVSEGAYAINHLMYRQIVRVLKDRNIIHLV